MPVEIVNVAIVVLIENHIPGVVHPLFLTEHGIAPREWKLKGDLICTPPVSKVGYDSGLQITAEMGKLTVHDTLQERTPEGAIAPAFVAEYLRTLPQLKCKAVGVNFLCFLPEDDPSKYLLSKYVKTGTWNDDQTKPESAVLNLNYRCEGFTAGFRIDVGSKKSPGGTDEVAGVVFNANYNELIREVMDNSSTRLAIQAVERYGERLAQFREMAPRILE